MKTDLIIIGSGQHGLTAAALCAKNGLKVSVVEASQDVGGLHRPYEFHKGFFSPGILHDDSHVWPEVIEDLGLNIRFSSEPYRFSIPLNRESKTQWITVSSQEKETIDSLSALGLTKDAQAFKKYQNELNEWRGFAQSFVRQPSLGLDLTKSSNLFLGAKTALKLRRLGKASMLELLKSAPMCIADKLNESFDTPELKAALSLPSVTGAFTGPWSPHSTLNHILWETLQTQPIEGGGPALIRALKEKCIELGVSFIFNTKVSRILISQGRAVGVSTNQGSLESNMVLSTLDPKTTFLNLVAPENTRVDFTTDVSRIRTRGGHAKLTLALSEQIKWSGSQNSFDRVRIAQSLDDVERAFDVLKYGELPSSPALDIYIKDRVLSALIYCAPYELKSGWSDANRTELYKRTLATLEKYSPGLSAKVVGYELLTPKDIEDRTGSSGGHVFHGEHAPDQLFMMRPTPACARYRTPITNLFLASSGSHPGGGLTGAAGFLAGKEINNA